jgi:glycerophosphoryl diester phosphodiesterase
VPPKPRLYAHRGAAAELPENTLPSFRRALEVGADALEMDVHLTRDGHVVVSHDPSGLRMAEVPRRISEATLEEVRQWDVGRGFARRERLGGRVFAMPTLEEVLVELPGIPLNIDAKHPEVVAPLVAVVRRLKRQKDVLLTSFRTASIARARALGYEGPTGLGRTEVARLVLLPAVLNRMRRLRGQAAQIPTRKGPFRLDAASFIARCHALGLLVHYWTINEPREAARLLLLGADGIMTDDPACIAPVFRDLMAGACQA